MKTTVVRYKLKKGSSSLNREYVNNVFAELKQKKPEGLRYASFQLEDGLTFVHIAVIESAAGSNPLVETDAFKSFVSNLRDRCDEPPLAMTAEVVGSYRLFWDKPESSE